MARTKSSRREGADNSLSFLDIMACGLGAVILIFLIIEHNIDSGGSVEADVFVEKLETMQQEMQRLSKEVDDIARRNADEERLGDTMAARRMSRSNTLAAIDQRMTAQEQQKRQLNQSRQELEKEVAESVVSSPDTGGEKFLVGLSIQGKHNAILIDHSASMTDETVARVITYKIRTPQARRSAPKWVRAKKAVKWMLDRLPEKSTAVVIGFAEQAKVLGGVNQFARTDAQKISAVITDLESLDPIGGTNLQAAFALAMQQTPQPTAYYLITDGLPTKGGAGAPKCERGGTVTAACRTQLFQHTFGLVQRGAGTASVNVVLLPLEGDWDAPNMYWSMTSGRGMVISPAPGWP